MPIKSYLAFAQKGRLPHMIAQLKECREVAVYPADNRDVAVLVTSCEDEGSEQRLKDELNRIPDLHCLTLVFGHTGQEGTPV